MCDFDWETDREDCNYATGGCGVSGRDGGGCVWPRVGQREAVVEGRGLGHDGGGGGGWMKGPGT